MGRKPKNKEGAKYCQEINQTGILDATEMTTFDTDSIIETEQYIDSGKFNHLLEDIKITSVRDSETNLLPSVKYIYDKYGFIDYKSLISPEYFVLNRWNYAKRGIDIDSLSEEQRANELSKVKEEDLLILLRGFKDIARIRGYTSMKSDLLHYSAVEAVVKVTIDWLPNIETGFEPLSVSCIKSAGSSEPSINQDFVHYLAAIAENRAFVTVVRNSLNIPIIGRDEIVDKKVEVKETSPKPNMFLEEFCKKRNITFKTVLSFIDENQLYEIDDRWTDFNKLPNDLSGTLLHLLSKES
jgi:hypothetical protein